MSPEEAPPDFGFDDLDLAVPDLVPPDFDDLAEPLPLDLAVWLWPEALALVAVDAFFAEGFRVLVLEVLLFDVPLLAVLLRVPPLFLAP